MGRVLSMRELACDCESPSASVCGFLVDMAKVHNTRTVVVQRSAAFMPAEAASSDSYVGASFETARRGHFCTDFAL